jgi:hypothetical protein
VTFTNAPTFIIVAFDGIVAGLLLAGWMFKLSSVRRYRAAVAMVVSAPLGAGVWRFFSDPTVLYLISVAISGLLFVIYAGQLNKHHGTVTVRQ